MSEKTTKTKKIMSKTSKKTTKEPKAEVKAEVKEVKAEVKEVKAEVKEAPKTITATVATDRYPLNIRNAADPESNIIGQIPKGSKIKVLDQPINGFHQLADKPGFVLGSKLKI